MLNPAAEEQEQEQAVTVSVTFQPNNNLLPTPPDMVVLSTDRVFFYVHSDFLQQHSRNNFNYLLPAMANEAEAEHQPPVLPVREGSQVMNVILHTIYGLPCEQFNPSNGTLAAAVVGLDEYGVPFDVHLAPGTPLFALLSARTPANPLFMYTLAGRFNLYELAVHASPFLLSMKPTDIPEAYADHMGPVYLQRLLALREQRLQALKDILSELPPGHPALDSCGAESQTRLATAWQLTAAYVLWGGKAELTGTSLEVTFERVGTSITCDACKIVFDQHLARVIQRWGQVKVRAPSPAKRKRRLNVLLPQNTI